MIALLRIVISITSLVLLLPINKATILICSDFSRYLFISDTRTYQLNPLGHQQTLIENSPAPETFV